MSDAGLAIIAAERKSACAGEPDFEARCRRAMAKVAESHWMFPGDHNADLRFRGAIGGVLLSDETTQEEKDRITATLNQLRSVAALMSGVPVNIEAMAKAQEENPPLPLLKWWHEAKNEK